MLNAESALKFFRMVHERGGLTQYELDLIESVIVKNERIDRLFDMMDTIYATYQIEKWDKDE